MSDAIQKARATAPAKAAGSDWQSLAARQDANPMQAVPHDCRPAVARLWMCNAHLFPSALALCATVRLYLDEQPITTDDVNSIVGRLLQPEARSRQKFASDVLADMSRMVAEACKRNVAREEAAKRKEDGEQFAAAKIASGLFKIE